MRNNLVNSLIGFFHFVHLMLCKDLYFILFVFVHFCVIICFIVFFFICL